MDRLLNSLASTPTDLAAVEVQVSPALMTLLERLVVAVEVEPEAVETTSLSNCSTAFPAVGDKVLVAPPAGVPRVAILV